MYSVKKVELLKHYPIALAILMHTASEDWGSAETNETRENVPPDEIDEPIKAKDTFMQEM